MIFFLISCKVLHVLELLLFLIRCPACFSVVNTAGLFSSLTAQHTVAESSHSSSLCPFHICLVLSDCACMHILQPCVTLHLCTSVEGQCGPCSAAAWGCDIKQWLWSCSGVLLVSHMPTVITTGRGAAPRERMCGTATRNHSLYICRTGRLQFKCVFMLTIVFSIIFLETVIVLVNDFLPNVLLISRLKVTYYDSLTN